MNGPKSRLPDFALRARREAEALGADGLRRLLEEGRRWDLGATLASGGAVLFPHIGLAECGAQTAAAVHACLDSGADRVLLLGVLHALTPELDTARRRVAAGDAPDAEVFWGIQGPGAPGRSDWEQEFSLLGFLPLWEEATRGRSCVPELVMRFPYLAGGAPERLPRMNELERLVADGAVVVATADLFHHGIGYGDGADVARRPDEGGLELAREVITEGLRLLRDGDHAAYQAHSVRSKSDARDVGQVLRHLTGPVDGRIVDLTWRDTSGDYGTGAPTWVAGALIKLTPV
jgi:hypothetical protein